LKILLTNDDGIYAPGLAALYHEFKSLGEVQVVAPDVEQSAVGHAITLMTPLRVKEVCLDGGLTGFAVSGFPADCVKIAMAELLPSPPDLVISGINLGPNVGINVLYSGTVSAATEAAILGVKGMAFSLDSYDQNADFGAAARLAREVMEQVRGWGAWNNGVCLNVNLPDLPRAEVKGVRVTRQDTGPLVEHFERRVDPRRHIYYWLAEINPRPALDPDTDYGALAQGYVSVTPIHHDLTDYHSLSDLQTLKWE
jgi:5'-nucleotidase